MSRKEAPGFSPGEHVTDFIKQCYAYDPVIGEAGEEFGRCVREAVHSDIIQYAGGFCLLIWFCEGHEKLAQVRKQ